MNTHNDIENIKSFVGGLFCRDSIKQTVIMFYSVVALSLFWYWPTPSPFRDSLGNRCIPSINVDREDNSENVERQINIEKSRENRKFFDEKITWRLFWTGSQKILVAFVLMGFFPILIVKFVFRENLSDYGVQWGKPLRTLNNILIFLPLMLILGLFSGRETGYYSVYPYNPYAFASITFFVAHSVLYFFLYYFSWEFMFRGFIQHGLEKSMNPTNAVWVQVLLSTMLHYGHPIPEVIGCVGGGLLWGFLVYRTKSIIAGWVQHAALGIALDASLIWYAIR